MSLWPRKVQIQDVITNSLWWLIAWFIGSLIILIIVFVASGVIDFNIVWQFEDSRSLLKTNSMFPFLLSFITFLATTVAVISTYFILNITDPERYKRNFIVLWQIAFFWIITYIFATPLYIFMWLQNYDYIMIVFIWHCILLSFGTSIILEIFSRGSRYKNITLMPGNSCCINDIFNALRGVFSRSVIELGLLSSGISK